MRTFLDVTLSVTGWLILIPFYIALTFRKRTVKGTQRWHRLNLVVVALRPLVRPVVVVYTAFKILDIVLDGWRWYVPLVILFQLLVFALYLSASNEDKDDDEGGPWNAIRKALSRLVPARLAMSGA